jgi:hypothetical protein
MRQLSILAASAEAATGLALVVSPALVAQLVLGGAVSGAGTVFGRLAGLALIGLGLAWWPVGDETEHRTSPLRSILTYNGLVALYLLGVGIDGESVGVLLWPAVAFHGLMTLLLGRARLAKSAR